MKITKFGHCCMLIREKDLTILTDPGSYTTEQNDIVGIDVILITHEHQDHFHIESVKEMLKKNPAARIVTNTSVGKLLEKEGIKFEVVEDGQSTTIGGVVIEGAGTTHAEIYEGIVPVQNTGYFIGTRLYYPGDMFYDPKKPVDILALPVSAPWLKISEVIDYALTVKPKVAFPVHDGGLNKMGAMFPGFLGKRFLEPKGIQFIVLDLNKEYDF